ncbi:MAG: PAS domain S-box protein [Candidatus Hydrogenedentes bacterium]|nr:PAS domain S-box protein [Candidatus Hydrogenedentota bacterium]
MSKVSDHGYNGVHPDEPLKRQDLQRLVQELRAENQQLRESYTTLKETERALRLLVDSLPGVAYRYRIKNRWLLDFIGKNCVELSGYPPEYFVEKGHSFVELIHPDDQARVLECASEGVTNHRPFSSEYRIRTADGSEKWVLEKGQGVWEDDTLVGTEGFILDITAQKQAEHEITESKERYRSLVELCPDGIAIHDGIHLLYGNAVALELFGGTTLEEAQQRTIADVIHPDCHELARKRVGAMLRGEPTPLVEEVFVRADGTCFDAEVAARPIVYQGNPAVLVIFRDITSRKKTHQRLQEALSRFEAVVEQTPLVAVQGVDRDGRIRHWNRASAALFGLSAKEVEGKRLQDIFPTPDGSNSFLQSVQRVWDTGQALPPCEWEFVLPNGVRRWVYATIFPILQDGVTEEAFVMQIDITSRRQMEEELRQTQELLRSIVVNLPLAVFLKDAKEFRFLLWNKCNEEMLGLSEAEVLHKTDYDLFPKEQAD